MTTTATHRPLSRRINFRLIFVLALVAIPFSYFGYLIVQQAMTGGVVDRGDYVAVDLKSMGFFPFDPVKDSLDSVPPQFRKLDGKRVMLEGEMWAPNEASDRVRQFELVYSIAKCCFGGPPKVQERVFANVPKGKPPVENYQYRGFVRVVGTLHVNLNKQEGQVVSLYEMDVESVEPIS